MREVPVDLYIDGENPYQLLNINTCSCFSFSLRERLAEEKDAKKYFIKPTFSHCPPNMGNMQSWTGICFDQNIGPVLVSTWRAETWEKFWFPFQPICFFRQTPHGRGRGRKKHRERERERLPRLHWNAWNYKPVETKTNLPAITIGKAG